MNARPSYLRSFSDRRAGVTLPVLRVPAAPLWPLRSAAVDPFPGRSKPQTAVPSDRAGKLHEITPVHSEEMAHSSDRTRLASRASEQNLETLRPAEIPPSRTETPRGPRETHAPDAGPTPGVTQPGTETRSGSAPAGATPNPSTTQGVAPLPGNAITPASSNPGRNTQPAPARASSTHFAANPGEDRASGNPGPASIPGTELEPLLLLERASLRASAPQPGTPGETKPADPHNSVHIGKIDIHIAPPPAAPVPRRPMRQMPVNPGAALASGFLSSFGLRQG